MKIKYLGTSGGGGVPALFCQCDVCNYAREHRGKNVKTSQQAIIDNRLLIDLGPDTYLHSVQNNLDLSVIEHCILTHTHGDHFYPGNLYMRKFSKTSANLNVYATQGVISSAQHLTDEFKVTPICVEYFKEYSFDNYKIVPLKAKHGNNEGSIYLISNESKTLLYGHDTGDILNEVYDFLKAKNIRLDFVTLDCTGAFNPTDTNQHLNVDSGVYVKKRLLEIGCADKNTRFYFSHFSHNNIHDVFSKQIEQYGFSAAYDGLEIEI